MYQRALLLQVRALLDGVLDLFPWPPHRDVVDARSERCSASPRQFRAAGPVHGQLDAAVDRSLFQPFRQVAPHGDGFSRRVVRSGMDVALLLRPDADIELHRSNASLCFRACKQEPSARALAPCRGVILAVHESPRVVDRGDDAVGLEVYFFASGSDREQVLLRRA
jgi:hypothetical protein